MLDRSGWSEVKEGTSFFLRFSRPTEFYGLTFASSNFYLAIERRTMFLFPFFSFIFIKKKGLRRMLERELGFVCHGVQ